MSHRTAVVSGGNDGIGFELVQLLATRGWHVFLGSRSLEKGRDAKDRIEKSGKLAGKVDVVQLDITDGTSVKNAAEFVRQNAAGGVVHALVNNAGVGYMTKIAEQKPNAPDEALLKEIVDTNIHGTVRTTTAFLPLVLAAPAPASVVFVSSDMASTGLMSSAVGNPQSFLHHLLATSYNLSKAAVNSYAVHVAASNPTLKVNCVSPGFTATKLNDFGKHGRGAKTPADSAARIAEFVEVTEQSPTGKFFGFDKELPW